MFGLLNPFLLWLAPLLAGPVLIHFLGRAEPKVRDFPSLLPVRGQLLRAMQRHQLKNWLLLILRTLVLLCLLLAAAGLVWRAPSKWTPPVSTALLLNNGAYGGGRALDAQQQLRHQLDSLTPGRNDAELLIPDAPPGRAVARFGDYPEAIARLMRHATSAQGGQFGQGGGGLHIFLPVYDARDLAGLSAIVRPWLERNPEACLVWIDRTDAGDADRPAAWVAAFGGVASDFSKEGQVRLRAALTPSAASAKAVAPLWKPDGEAAREARVENGFAEITVPVTEGKPLAGTLTFGASTTKEQGTFAEPSHAVSYRIPPPATLCVAAPSAGWIARATLGEGSRNLKVVSLLSTGDLQSTHCDLLYAADPENPDAALWARAAAVLRGGGKVIVGTGRHTDAALLNRNLLEPLGFGRLTALATHGSLAARPNAGALAKLGLRGESWGRPGAVRQHLGFLPGPGTSILLAAQQGTETVPLLAHAKAGAGELLLWTTDISDPDWSDLGLGPWATLLHQGFLGRAWGAGPEALTFASDSVVWFPLPEDAEARVTDPQGFTFARATREPGGLRVGPFDRTGLYHLETRQAGVGASEDTLPFAVNLATSRLAEPSEEAVSEAWDALERDLGPDAFARTARLRDPDEWRGLYGGTDLRTSLLVLAALLLFAEGLVSLRLSPFRT